MQNRCPIQAGHLIGSLCPTGPPRSPVPTVATSEAYEIIPEAKDSLLMCVGGASFVDVGRVYMWAVGPLWYC